MTFTSSYEQDARILVETKRQLASAVEDSKLRELYSQLQKFHLFEVKLVVAPRSIKGLCFSSLLQQIQVGRFLGMNSTSTCILDQTAHIEIW